MRGQGTATFDMDPAADSSDVELSAGLEESAAHAGSDADVPSPALTPALDKVLKVWGLRGDSRAGRMCRFSIALAVVCVYHWASAYSFWHLNGGADPRFKRGLAIFLGCIPVVHLVAYTNLRSRGVRTDGTGFYDQFAAMPVTAVAHAKLAALDKAVEKGTPPGPGMVLWMVCMVALWYIQAFDVHWSTYVVMYIGHLWVFMLAQPSMNMLLVGSAIICEDQFEQCCDHIRLIGDTSDAEHGEHWKNLGTMAQVGRVCGELVPLCQKQSPAVLARFANLFTIAIYFTYGTLMGHTGDSVVFKFLILSMASTFFFSAFNLFNGMLSVTAKGRELVQCCNDLRLRLPNGSEHKIDRLMAYVMAINDGQGPGYTVLGVLITPKLVWGACVTVLSTAAALGLSIME